MINVRPNLLAMKIPESPDKFFQSPSVTERTVRAER